MTKQELTDRMARVAVALNRRADTFRVDARPFGDGWAVFIDGNFDVAFLEQSARSPTEGQACEGAWYGVHKYLVDERDRYDEEIRELRASLARKEHDLAMVTAALRLT